MVSLEILQQPLAHLLPAGNEERDLALHLVASHHGHARPLAPFREESSSAAVAAPDFDPPIQWQAGGADYIPAHHLGSGVPERFWRLTRHYGWWGLAVLEAMLRLADWQASAGSTPSQERVNPLQEAHI
jgi:CRISPR-associated endonuclease/helicase Cas3